MAVSRRGLHNEKTEETDILDIANRHVIADFRTCGGFGLGRGGGLYRRKDRFCASALASRVVPVPWIQRDRRDGITFLVDLVYAFCLGQGR